MGIRFAKMHGAGNDLVIVDCLGGEPVEDWAGFARYALDRHLGVGGDQLLLVLPSQEPTSAWASATPTAARPRCAPTASAPSTSTCATAG